MKIIFGTVVYKQAWKWCTQFIDSINHQSEQCFDVLIINDGLSPEEIRFLEVKLRQKCYIYNVEGHESISNIRIFLIMQAKQLGYDLLILGDFDDTFSDNRVKRIRATYNSKYGFFYNNLQYDKCDDVIFTSLPNEVTELEQILEANFLGLSNTALNLNMLSYDFLVSLESVETDVFDWYLYARIVAEGINGLVVRNTYTIYRQSQNNIVGVNRNDYASICKEIVIKREQYRLLQKYSSLADKLYKSYEKLIDAEMSQLSAYINFDTNNYWWSNLKTLNKEENGNV